MAVNKKTGSSRILTDGEWCISGQEKVTWTLGPDSEIGVFKDDLTRAESGKGLCHNYREAESA